MQNNSNENQRHSIRLHGYDYSQIGAYFITMCVNNRENLFGKIINHRVKLNDAGKMIDNQWNELPKRFNHIYLDSYIVMPNHLHGVVIVGAPLVGARKTKINSMSENRAGTRPAPTGATIGDIIGAFKSITTREYINGVIRYHWPAFDQKLWQRNYYEHIIRDEESLNKIREYIINNPMQDHHL